MENINEIQSQVTESDILFNERRTKGSTGIAIKVQLPVEVATKVQNAMQVLKERKADVKVDELLADFLNEISDDYLERQIEKKTPDDYYFEFARTIPELREQVVKKARASLNQRLLGGEDTAVLNSKKNRKKKVDSSASDLNLEASIQLV